jgi:HEAT repeat protein
VGTQAMHVLIEVLKQNKMDSELCCLALDTLFNIVDTSEHSKEEPDTQSVNKEQEQILPADISAQFSEMFVKDKANVELLFELLDEFEFQVRWSTIKLLNALILNLTAQIQDIILQNPRSTARIIDLLTDSREVIRNDVSFCLFLREF